MFTVKFNFNVCLITFEYLKVLNIWNVGEIIVVAKYFPT